MATMTTYKLFPDKLGGTNSSNFIGNYGELFYDSTTGFLRRSDGVTPGGELLNMIGRQGYCGAFFDTTTQTNALPINKVSFNNSYISDGISIVDGTKITLAHSGRFNIQFSLQLDKSDSGNDDVELWLLRNGEAGPFTNTKFTLLGNNAKGVAAWNFVVEEPAGTYIELAWHSADAAVVLHYEDAKTNPVRPAIPSAIVTVTQV
jgi:hypothetical protein